MDNLLNEIKANVGEEIDLASSLLDVIGLIPTEPNDELLECLEKEKIEGNDEEREEAKTISSQLSTLWKIEASSIASRYRQKGDKTLIEESTSIVEQKSQELLLDATISAAKSIRESSPSIQKCLVEFEKKQKLKKEVCIEEEEKSVHFSSKLKEYLDQLKDVSCKDISTSVRKEQQLTSDLFKLHECCKTVEEEKVKSDLVLSVRECKINKDSTKLNDLLTTSTNALIEIKKQEEAKQHILDEKVLSFLKEQENQHSDVMESLGTELAKVEHNIHCLKRDHTSEQKEMIAQRQKIEEELSTLLSLHEQEEQKIQKQTLDISNKILNEQNERIRLEKLLILQDLNSNIAADEEVLIKSVIDLELEADAILFKAAAHLQKLYRGLRDRAIVKKLKKKSKKGKKQKGKKSKSK